MPVDISKCNGLSYAVDEVITKPEQTTSEKPNASAATRGPSEAFKTRADGTVEWVSANPSSFPIKLILNLAMQGKPNYM